jgi:hypothetical protein
MSGVDDLQKMLFRHNFFTTPDYTNCVDHVSFTEINKGAIPAAR